MKASSMLLNKAVYHKSCRSNYNLSMVQRVENKLKRNLEVSVDPLSPKKTRSKVSTTLTKNEPCCILCCEVTSEPLHRASTYSVDSTIKSWATKTRNTELLAKLASASDMHAMDAYYHRTCYVGLENSARSTDRAESSARSDLCAFDPLVMAELVAYVVESQLVFSLSVS